MVFNPVRVDFEVQAGGYFKHAFSIATRPPLNIISTVTGATTLVNFDQDHCMEAADSLAVALSDTPGGPITLAGTYRVNSIIDNDSLRIAYDSSACNHTFTGIGYPINSYESDVFLGRLYTGDPVYRTSPAKVTATAGNNVVFLQGAVSANLQPGDLFTCQDAGIDNALVRAVGLPSNGFCGDGGDDISVALSQNANVSVTGAGWFASGLSDVAFGQVLESSFTVTKDTDVDVFRMSLNTEGWQKGVRHYKILNTVGTENLLVVYGLLRVSHG